MNTCLHLTQSDQHWCTSLPWLTLPLQWVWEETKLCEKEPSPAGHGTRSSERVEGASSFPKFILWLRKNLWRRKCWSIWGIYLCACECHWCGLSWQTNGRLLIAPQSWKVITGREYQHFPFSMQSDTHKWLKGIRSTTKASWNFWENHTHLVC